MQVWFLCFALSETKGDRSEPPFPLNSFLNKFIFNLFIFFLLNTSWRFQTTGFVFLLPCFHFAPRVAPDSLAPLGTPTRILITVWATGCERLRGGDDDGGGGNWNQSSWATARATAAMSRNETDGRVATVAVWRRSIAPPEAAWRDPPAFPRGGRRSAWTHPVPDDLSEASVRLEVTLEGNSLSDDDGRQGLDGNSQISFRDRQRLQLNAAKPKSTAARFWKKNENYDFFFVLFCLELTSRFSQFFFSLSLSKKKIITLIVHNKRTEQKVKRCFEQDWHINLGRQKTKDEKTKTNLPKKKQQ